MTQKVSFPNLILDKIKCPRLSSEKEYQWISGSVEVARGGRGEDRKVTQFDKREETFTMEVVRLLCVSEGSNNLE